MKRRLSCLFGSQRGVAMVTVLLIGSALTIVGSAAAFVTIEEFRSGSDDRKALAALSYAEAGIDRMVNHLRTGLVTFNDLNAAGCSNAALALPDGNVGVGSYSVSMTVYDPFASDPDDRFPIAPSSGACADRPDSPHPGQNGDDQTFFVITSVGRHPAATRTIRQVIAMEPVRLPIGIYANSIDINSASHPFTTVSMISETTITNRRTVGFTGDDPYYLMSDFFSGVTNRNLSDPIPASAHAAGTIYLRPSSDREFQTATKNCTANFTGAQAPGAVASQSLWDSDGSTGSGGITSGCTGQTGWPSSSKFEQSSLEALATPNFSAQDHQVLKEAAQRYGVYCSFATAGDDSNGVCIKQGASATSSYEDHVEAVAVGTRSFVVYLEFLNGSSAVNNIEEIFSVWGCNDDPDLNRSVVVIVRNGGIDWKGAAGQQLNGALIVDGDYKAIGGFDFNGSLIVKGSITINSSAQHYTLDDCWVKNMPGPFMRAVPTQWSEIDR